MRAEERVRVRKDLKQKGGMSHFSRSAFFAGIFPWDKQEKAPLADGWDLADLGRSVLRPYGGDEEGLDTLGATSSAFCWSLLTVANSRSAAAAFPIARYKRAKR